MVGEGSRDRGTVLSASLIPDGAPGGLPVPNRGHATNDNYIVV